MLKCSDNATILGNQIEDIINFGIRLSISNNCNVMENSINNSPKSNGIILLNSSRTAISENAIRNTDDGVEFYDDSMFNHIKENTIVDNNNGIRIIHNSNNNQIYHNNLINNTQNAYDECNNTWDNGYPSGGNYWDDYTGNDSDGDGIGDTPYNISGGNNSDRYPLMEPYGNGDENETFFGTLGPICPLLNIAEINLIDGNESQIQKIEKILNNRILQFIIPLRWGFINVTELDFTITYNKEIPKIPFWLNFYYATILFENEMIPL